MFDDIMEKFTKTINDALTRIAEKYNIEKKRCSLAIGLDKEAKITYHYCIDYIAKEQVTFNKVCGVKFYAGPTNLGIQDFIHIKLVEFAKDYGIQFEDISILIFLYEGQVVMCLYNGVNQIKQIEIEDLVQNQMA